MGAHVATRMQQAVKHRSLSTTSSGRSQTKPAVRRLRRHTVKGAYLTTELCSRDQPPQSLFEVTRAPNRKASCARLLRFSPREMQALKINFEAMQNSWSRIRAESVAARSRRETLRAPKRQGVPQSSSFEAMLDSWTEIRAECVASRETPRTSMHWS